VPFLLCCPDLLSVSLVHQTWSSVTPAIITGDLRFSSVRSTASFSSPVFVPSAQPPSISQNTFFEDKRTISNLLLSLSPSFFLGRGARRHLDLGRASQTTNQYDDQNFPQFHIHCRISQATRRRMFYSSSRQSTVLTGERARCRMTRSAG
jgi:hypothetical protein